MNDPFPVILQELSPPRPEPPGGEAPPEPWPPPAAKPPELWAPAAAGAALYLLVALEFFYMASPFAAYFYSAYLPGLTLLERVPRAAWLLDFFLPHCVAQTHSALLDGHNLLGALLTVVGLGLFAVAAVQVYAAKLRRAPAVTSGPYRHLRHPQYVALAIAGLGLLLLWPRYLNLLAYLCMLGVYHALALFEERDCARRFGTSYTDYARRTARFWPFGKLPPAPSPGLARGRLTQFGIFAAALGLALGAARGLEVWTLGSLFARYQPGAVYLSVVATSPELLGAATRLLGADARVNRALDGAGRGRGARFVIYLLPTDWFISEIPMHIPPEAACHAAPGDYDPTALKAIITRARLDPARPAAGRQILDLTRSVDPVLEVWLDLRSGVVNKWRRLDHPPRYPGVPVPLY